MIRLLLLLFLAVPCVAATYYVSPGGNDAGAGTIGDPFKTIGHVDGSFLDDGDTVYFRTGSYTNQQLAMNIAKTNLTFEAYNGETVIWCDWTGGAFDTAQTLIQGASSNLVFRGIIWSNNYANVNVQNAVAPRFENCTIGYRGTLGTANQQMNFYSCRYAVVTNCTFTTWGSSASGDDTGSFIHIGSFLAGDTTDCFGNLITDCTFKYGGHDCLQIYSPSNVVRRCRFFNPNWMPYAGNFYGNRLIELITSWAQPNLIEECDFGYSGIPVDSPATATTVETSTSRLILRKNRFFDNQGAAVDFYQKGFNATPSSNYVYHNSMLLSGLNTIAAPTYWNSAIVWAHGSCSNNVIANNAIYRVGTNGEHAAFSGLTLGVTNNFFSGNLTNTIDIKWVSTNTSSAALTVPDLHLQGISPAINAGVFLTTITSADGSGTSFTVANPNYFYDGWAIPGETGDTIQLAGQTSTAIITDVNYDTGEITTATSVTWTTGQGVGLPYFGSAPDIGAYEYSAQVPLWAPKIFLRGTYKAIAIDRR